MSKRIEKAVETILSNTKPICQPYNIELFLDDTGVDHVNLQIGTNVPGNDLYTVTAWVDAGQEMDSVEICDEVCVDVLTNSVNEGIAKALNDLHDALRTKVDMIIEDGHDHQRQAELAEYWADERREAMRDDD